MPDNGTYLLTTVGFSSNEEPFLLLGKDETFLSFNPIGEKITLAFDMSQRHCTGWRDITTGERFTCPEKQLLAPKYEQCAACQKRTGFNPAFYHATSVSSQQEARNNEPHILYLAHFGPGVIKVGISHAKRGNARLIEQGARSALILDTFPSAHIARQYEAKIAALPNIAETIQLRKKIDMLLHPYDHTAAQSELENIKKTIETTLEITFTHQQILMFDEIYFPHGIPQLSDIYPVADQHMISGEAIGLLGSLLLCRQGEKVFYLPLKQHVGYQFIFTNEITETTTPARQTSLF
jgi:hypothetical protein